MTTRAAELGSRLEAIRASLEAGDDELALAQLEAFGADVRCDGGAGADAHVVALFKRCEGLAVERLGQLAEQLRGSAVSARAAAAYGGER
ncbi:MAG: hypothetical protein INH41_30335 [Myxococcaceae bacterium]|nr:hypothetical protein [Myxococcaceae bacterium]